MSFCGLQQRLVAETISAKMKIFLYCYLCTAQKLSFQKVANCFFLRSGFFFSVDRVENKTLALHKVTRSQMGSYLCIATNGYPPAVSKKVQLKVNCKFFWNWIFAPKMMIYFSSTRYYGRGESYYSTTQWRCKLGMYFRISPSRSNLVGKIDWRNHFTEWQVHRGWLHFERFYR